MRCADGGILLRLARAGNARRQPEVELVEVIDLLVQCVEIAVVYNDIVGRLQARGPVSLGRQDRVNLLL